jgi:DNA replication protein DnaC
MKRMFGDGDNPIKAEGIIRKKFQCPDHGEYLGYEMTIRGEQVGSICPACHEQIIKDEASSRVAEIKQRCGGFVPVAFQRKGFAEFHPENKMQETAVKLAADYVIGFPEVLASGKSMLITGRGRGKTHIACAILRNVDSKGYSTRYVVAGGYLSEVKKTWRSGSEEGEDVVLERFTSPELLVIDNLGDYEMSKGDPERLFQLVNNRAGMGRPTVAVSGKDERVLRRVVGDCIVNKLSGCIIKM